ncbi:head-tail adaptor protein [Shewanella algae]|uniref:phage head completion protein n=1 Tax=Shewanella algae TaxID=38313 RepID=UPI00300658D1
MISAGQLRTPIYTMRPVQQRDEYGAETDIEYIRDKKLMARVKHINRNVNIDTGSREYLTDSVEIYCRYSSSLENMSLDYRILIKDKLYEIDTIQNQFYQNNAIVITATFNRE